MCVLKTWLEDSNAKLPEISVMGSACYDIFSIEDKTIQPGGFEYVENGVRLIIPDGYYIRFNTRSSLGFIKDLFVYPGILDASWSGNLKVKVYNFGKEPYTIKKGDKYCQFELLKCNESKIENISKDDFDNITKKLIRGNNGGWGSSGK
ncbi:putative dUTP pyrophosphatase [Campylobacter phage PC5]|uniref:dUTP diphosphatase n=2 Tax=Fletchervirus TaxID=1636618 RepID=A0A1B0XVG8_9CAUD|nr:putative dUTP pyrophosphatase [Campylobacter phage PC5]AVR55701.1 deoxyuridine 5'-triphosphate nucleotidohydrolase [Campylobacter phage CP39]WGA02311.1 putative dUTP pyrophosphatase [Campylobacter phage vB_Cj_QDYZ]